MFLQSGKIKFYRILGFISSSDDFKIENPIFSKTVHWRLTYTSKNKIKPNAENQKSKHGNNIKFYKETYVN